MRIFLFLLLTIPSIAFTQINRSAKELAGENIKDYVVKQLFIQKSYEPVSYGTLKEYNDKANNIRWSLSHTFQVMEKEIISGKEMKVWKSYSFTFYLNREMKVKKAEGYYVN